MNTWDVSGPWNPRRRRRSRTRDGATPSRKLLRQVAEAFLARRSRCPICRRCLVRFLGIATRSPSERGASNIMVAASADRACACAAATAKICAFCRTGIEDLALDLTALGPAIMTARAALWRATPAACGCPATTRPEGDDAVGPHGGRRLPVSAHDAAAPSVPRMRRSRLDQLLGRGVWSGGWYRHDLEALAAILFDDRACDLCSRCFADVLEVAHAGRWRGREGAVRIWSDRRGSDDARRQCGCDVENLCAGCRDAIRTLGIGFALGGPIGVAAAIERGLAACSRDGEPVAAIAHAPETVPPAIVRRALARRDS